VCCLVIGLGSMIALRGGPQWQRRFPRLAATAELAGGFFRERPSSAMICFCLFLVVWLIEALDTFVIAHLLGLRLSIGATLGFESVIALGRATAFFLPGGLGIQDLGHLLLVRAAGPVDV